MSIAAQRPPEARFADIPDYPFAASYLEDMKGYEGLRIHFLDEGPKDAAVTFLCLHGTPSWSYLYRKMIPVMTQSGHRAVAPDLLDFERHCLLKMQVTLCLNEGLRSR